MNPKRHRILIVATICSVGLSPGGLCAETQNIKKNIEALRDNIPKAVTISEMNGATIKDIKGKHYTLTVLASAADKLSVKTKKDAQILISYLEDPDIKIRFIAASALEKKLKAYPNGMSTQAIFDSGSKYHQQLIERFSKSIESTFKTVK